MSQLSWQHVGLRNKFWSARFRLYRSRCLQRNIYVISFPFTPLNVLHKKNSGSASCLLQNILDNAEKITNIQLRVLGAKRRQQSSNEIDPFNDTSTLEDVRISFQNISDFFQSYHKKHLAVQAVRKIGPQKGGQPQTANPLSDARDQRRQRAANQHLPACLDVMAARRLRLPTTA